MNENKSIGQYKGVLKYCSHLLGKPRFNYEKLTCMRTAHICPSEQQQVNWPEISAL